MSRQSSRQAVPVLPDRLPHLGYARRSRGRLGSRADQAAGNDVLGVGPQPQVVGDDLDDVADQLIRRYGAGAAN